LNITFAYTLPQAAPMSETEPIMLAFKKQEGFDE
jgi:hypothetical protein